MEQKRRTNNRGTGRTKFEQVILKKTYDNFFEGLQLLKDIYDPIREIFNGEENDIESVKESIVRDFSKNIPDFSNPKTKYRALNISASRVSYKLSNVAFGWQVVYNREDDTTTYQFTVIITSYRAMTEIGNKLEKELGWERSHKNK